MYKVKYYLPRNFLREILMDHIELDSWLRHRWLKERIFSIEKVH